MYVFIEELILKLFSFFPFRLNVGQYIDKCRLEKF